MIDKIPLAKQFVDDYVSKYRLLIRPALESKDYESALIYISNENGKIRSTPGLSFLIEGSVHCGTNFIGTSLLLENVLSAREVRPDQVAQAQRVFEAWSAQTKLPGGDLY